MPLHRQSHIVCGTSLQLAKRLNVGTFDGRVIFINEVALNQLDRQC